MSDLLRCGILPLSFFMGGIEHIQNSSPEAYAHLTPIELLQGEIKTQRLERIDVSKIVLEASIVDGGHINNLADSMKGPRGQISPLSTRARLVGPELIHYDVIDGFHRSYGLVALEEEWADSVVLYGCPDEELFDLRVLAANSVRSVQYARVTKWMQYSFSQTDWAKRGFLLSQITSLAVTDSSGTKLGLSKKEAKEAKKWALEKAKIWNKPVSTIWQMSRTLEAADPELVREVRISGGRKGKGILTPARLVAIVTPLAGRYEIQRKVVDVVLSGNISAEDTQKLARKVARVVDEPEKVKHILSEASNPKKHRAEDIKKRINQEVKKESDIFFEQEFGDSYNVEDTALLEEKNKDLTEALARARDIIQGEKTLEGDLFWWRIFPDLTPFERKILTLAIDEGDPLEIIANKLNVLPRNIIRHLFSGLRKYAIYLDEIELSEHCRFLK